VNGFKQDPIAGVSMAYALGDAKAPGTRKTQFFDIMASRGIYHEGWFASAPGPREPWVGGMPEGHQGMVAADGQVGAVQHRRGLEPGERPCKREPQEARADEGAVHRGIEEEQEPAHRRRAVVHRHVPSGRRSGFAPHRVDLRFPITRMPESAAPKLGKVDSLVTMEVDVPANANGVLYALAGFSGGITAT
jgi:hypothetical protein